MQPLTLDLEGALRTVEGLLAQAARSDDPELTEMAGKMVLAGGKRLRPRIMMLAYAACGGQRPAPELLEAAAGIELIHTATLVHDDVIDRGDRRRGTLSTYREYGPERALICGDFLFTRGFELAARQDEVVVGITARACQRLAEGELLELRLQRLADLDLEAYLRIIDAKTAAPLEACGRIGAHLAGRDDLMEALGAYGRHLGLAFQVTDDLLDVRGDPAVTGKPRGTDLRTGAPNAPLLLGMRNGARAKLERLLAAPGRGEAEVQQALDALRESGALDEAEALAAEHAGLAVRALAPLPEGPARRALAAQVRGLPTRAA